MNPDKLEFDGYVQDILHFGSRVTCNPPPVDTDDDYLLYVFEENVEYLEQELYKRGFQRGGSFDLHSGCNFYSYKKNDLNLVVTWDRKHFDLYTEACNLCKQLNLLDKQDRCDLYRIVTKGNRR